MRNYRKNAKKKEAEQWVKLFDAYGSHNIDFNAFLSMYKKFYEKYVHISHAPFTFLFILSIFFSCGLFLGDDLILIESSSNTFVSDKDGNIGGDIYFGQYWIPSSFKWGGYGSYFSTYRKLLWIS